MWKRKQRFQLRLVRNLIGGPCREARWQVACFRWAICALPWPCRGAARQDCHC
jgi:hypothetical protein